MRASNLRNLFHRVGTPQAIRNCEPIFRKLVDPQVRNTLVTDILGLALDRMLIDEDELEPATLRAATVLPPPLQDCIRNTFGHCIPATLLPRIRIGGLSYSPFSKHLGNASILLRSGSAGVFQPARIDFIVQVVHEAQVGTLVAVRKYLKATGIDDPFSPYPFLRAQLWSRNLGALELHELGSIECHFAHLPFLWQNQDLMAIISLSRVSGPFYPPFISRMNRLLNATFQDL